jgi:hypothetical protein
MQPTVATFSLILPLAQKTLPLKFDFLKVGQVGHKQSLALSSLSETGFLKNPTK